MNSNEKKMVFQRMTLANEQVGRQSPSVAAMESLCNTLDDYQCPAILAAIDAAVMSTDFITPRAITEQLDKMQRSTDGHPEPNEAWSIAAQLSDELATVAYTEIIMLCWGLVSQLHQSDEIGARMSFLDIYRRELGFARDRRVQAVWRVSLGHDPDLRAAGVDRAKKLGRIGAGDLAWIGNKPLSIEHVQTLAIEKNRSDVVNISDRIFALRSAIKPNNNRF